MILTITKASEAISPAEQNGISYDLQQFIPACQPNLGITPAQIVISYQFKPAELNNDVEVQIELYRSEKYPKDVKYYSCKAIAQKCRELLAPTGNIRAYYDPDGIEYCLPIPQTAQKALSANS